MAKTPPKPTWRITASRVTGSWDWQVLGPACIVPLGGRASSWEEARNKVISALVAIEHNVPWNAPRVDVGIL